MNLDAPTTLPVAHLSQSSIDQYLRCPEKWRRKYIEREREARAGHLILGSAIHQAESQSYSHKVETGEPHSAEEVLDEFRGAFQLEASSTSEDVDWGEFTPGETIDRGARLLGDYHAVIPHLIQPEKVETEFNIRLHPSYEWVITGKIDIIGDYDDGGFHVVKNATHDLKSVKRAINQDDLDNSIQGSWYAASRILEGVPVPAEGVEFLIHELKATKRETSSRILRTTRTHQQAMRTLERGAAVAREIAWRAETGNWQGAPPNAWWCRASQCGFAYTCPFYVARP